MNRNHPPSKRAAVLTALLTVAGMVGCQSTSTAFNNPFQRPDRVPPPATRTLLPGQAAPDYPGDPLPAMQSSTNGTQAAPALASTTAQPTATSTLAASPRSATSSGSEASVAIPGDDDALRFALPKPAPAPVPSPTPTPAVAQPTSQFAGTPATSPVSQAVFNQTAPMAQGPWRSPQIARQTALAPQPLALGPPPSSPTYAPAPSMPSGAVQVASAPTSSGNMPVRLRAVPSPPPEPVEASSPRIRIPGYAAPPTAGTQPGAVQQAAYYTAISPPPGAVVWPNGTVQTLQVGPVTPIAYAPTAAALGGGDGFRPRGSMR